MDNSTSIVQMNFAFAQEHNHVETVTPTEFEVHYCLNYNSMMNHELQQGHTGITVFILLFKAFHITLSLLVGSINGIH